MMRPKHFQHLLCTAAFFLGLLSGTARAEDIVYPADSGVLNVKTPPYNAKGDGITDDTRAIQSALAAGLNKHNIVYLPNGTYLVSNTLEWNDGTRINGGWGRFLSLQGQSEAGTIIKLQNRTPGFTGVGSPKAVVMTASGDDNNQYSDVNGEGNQAFENHIHNLTIDTGTGNSSAIGIDYQVSNWGAIRNVTIKSSDPAHVGYAGISLQRRDNGPGLIKNVTIDGFEYGVIANQEIVQMTLENIILRRQSVVGVYDGGAVFAIRKLHSRNTVPAVRVESDGLLNLLDADLLGGHATASAVEIVSRDSRALLRHVLADGYASVVTNRGQVFSGHSVIEWVSDPAFHTFPSPSVTLDLPIQETPTYSDMDFAHWANVRRYQRMTDPDDTAAIQHAMNSGKSTIYFPAGRYLLAGTITVPATVKHVLGMGMTLSSAHLNGRPLFEIRGGTAQDCTIFDRLTLYPGSSMQFEDASPRALVLRDLGGAIAPGGGIYRSLPGAGRLFIEDVAGAGYVFTVPQKVWGRQWNAEGSAPIKITNQGATVWALGLKSESADVIIDTESGGRTEVFGGLFYTFGDHGQPACINTNGAVSLSFAGASYLSNGFYHTLLLEKRGDRIKTFPTESAFRRGGGVSLPLYTGYRR